MLLALTELIETVQEHCNYITRRSSIDRSRIVLIQRLKTRNSRSYILATMSPDSATVEALIRIKEMLLLNAIQGKDFSLAPAFRSYVPGADEWVSEYLNKNRKYFKSIVFGRISNITKLSVRYNYREQRDTNDLITKDVKGQIVLQSIGSISTLDLLFAKQYSHAKGIVTAEKIANPVRY